jgi:hypothetical protein
VYVSLGGSFLWLVFVAGVRKMLAVGSFLHLYLVLLREDDAICTNHDANMAQSCPFLEMASVYPTIRFAACWRALWICVLLGGSFFCSCLWQVYTRRRRLQQQAASAAVASAGSSGTIGAL